MSAEALIRRLYDDVWTGRRYEAASEIFHPDFTSPGAPGLRGPEAKLNAIRMYHATFPDLEVHVEEIVATEQTAAARYVIQGTDEGGIRGRPPTGRHVVSWGVDFFGLTERRISSNWVGADWLGTLVQLGIVDDPWKPTAG
jgi:predicted ester cyclase